MSLDPYLQNILIRSHIAELHREAAQRQLIRQARRSAARPRSRSIIPTLARAFSIAWLKRDIERHVLP
jgi:hypothetical protein